MQQLINSLSVCRRPSNLRTRSSAGTILHPRSCGASDGDRTAWRSAAALDRRLRAEADEDGRNGPAVAGLGTYRVSHRQLPFEVGRREPY